MNQPNTTPQSLGGQKCAKIQRAQAEKRYYENPNYCKLCKKIIPVIPSLRVADIKIKQFCDINCRTLFFQAKPKSKTCKGCKNLFEIPITKRSSRIRYCEKCRNERLSYSEKLNNTTKGYLFANRKNWQSARTDIRRHAADIFKKYNKSKECHVCKYNLHTEICHIKSVSSFADDTLLSVINHPDNLIALCPNHHWEFDNNKIKLGAGIEVESIIYSL